VITGLPEPAEGQKGPAQTIRGPRIGSIGGHNQHAAEQEADVRPSIASFHTAGSLRVEVPDLW